MSNFRSSLEASLKDYPILMSSKDLVKIGLYSSIDQAYQARLYGLGPSYIQPDRKVLYHKETLIQYMCGLLVENKVNKGSNESLYNDEASS
jgi:hypothetical protein